MKANPSDISELSRHIEQDLEAKLNEKICLRPDATSRLLSELALGQESADKEGWLSSEEVEQSLGLYESLEGYTNE